MCGYDRQACAVACGYGLPGMEIGICTILAAAACLDQAAPMAPTHYDLAAATRLTAAICRYADEVGQGSQHAGSSPNFKYLSDPNIHRLYCPPQDTWLRLESPTLPICAMMKQPVQLTTEAAKLFASPLSSHGHVGWGFCNKCTGQLAFLVKCSQSAYVCLPRLFLNNDLHTEACLTQV